MPRSWGWSLSGAFRRLCVVFFVVVAMVYCSCGSPPSPTSPWIVDHSPLTSPGPLANAPAPLITPTYDGSGISVEPTVLYFPTGWQGHLYWMVISPYPHDNNQFENPSILVSDEGQNWSVPAGLTNPIERPTQGTLADATLFFDEKSNQLWVYYLNDSGVGDEFESLLRTTSPDGIHWSTPKVVISGLSLFLLSPSVNKVGDVLYLWTVDVGAAGCSAQTSTVNQRISSDGVRWSAPRKLNISQSGYVIWHLNTIPIPAKGQFMSLLTAYPVGSDCGSTKLFFANSHDGINWQTYPQILLNTGKGWDKNQIYRSSLLYDANSGLFRVWYSANGGVEWHVGYSQELFSVQ